MVAIEAVRILRARVAGSSVTIADRSHARPSPSAIEGRHSEGRLLRTVQSSEVRHVAGRVDRVHAIASSVVGYAAVPQWRCDLRCAQHHREDGPRGWRQDQFERSAAARRSRTWLRKAKQTKRKRLKAIGSPPVGFSGLRNLGTKKGAESRRTRPAVSERALKRYITS